MQASNTKVLRAVVKRYCRLARVNEVGHCNRKRDGECPPWRLPATRGAARDTRNTCDTTVGISRCSYFSSLSTPIVSLTFGPTREICISTKNGLERKAGARYRREDVEYPQSAVRKSVGAWIRGNTPGLNRRIARQVAELPLRSQDVLLWRH